MPREITLLRKDPDLVAKYCASFGQEEKLKQAHTKLLVDSRFWHCMESLHGQVGFSFITAHSKDLFGRDEASLEDCNLNHEVRVACMICLHVSLMHVSPMVVFLFMQAIFAVMTVTPHARLSETVLAKAICQYYHENRLVPIGIGLSAD